MNILNKKLVLWHDQFEDFTFEGSPSADVVATDDNDPGTLVVVEDVDGFID